MSAVNHYEALLLKLHQLQRKLRAAYKNHLPEHIIFSIKKQKLSIKEEMLFLKKQCSSIKMIYGKNEDAAA